MIGIGELEPIYSAMCSTLVYSQVLRALNIKQTGRVEMELIIPVFLKGTLEKIATIIYYFYYIKTSFIILRVTILFRNKKVQFSHEKELKRVKLK